MKREYAFAGEGPAREKSRFITLWCASSVGQSAALSRRRPRVQVPCIPRCRSRTDNAPGYEPGEWGFDSLRQYCTVRYRARHFPRRVKYREARTGRLAAKAPVLQTGNRGFESHSVYEEGGQADELALNDWAQNLSAFPSWRMKQDGIMHQTVNLCRYRHREFESRRPPV